MLTTLFHFCRKVVLSLNAAYQSRGPQDWKIDSPVWVLACVVLFVGRMMGAASTLLFCPPQGCRALVDVTRCRPGCLAGRIIIKLICAVLLGSLKCPLSSVLWVTSLLSQY